jgi:hypothetical protein
LGLEWYVLEAEQGAVLEEWVKLLGAPIALILIGLWTGFKGYWVWGRELTNEQERRREAEKRGDAWQTVALTASGIAEQLASVQGKAGKT